MSNPQVAAHPRLPPGQIPIGHTKKYASTSEDDNSPGYHPRGRGRGRGRGGPAFPREQHMDNRRRAGGGGGEGSGWANSGGPRGPSRGQREYEEPSRGSPRTRRPTREAKPHQEDEYDDDLPGLRAQREAARKKADAAKWVNSGSNGARIYNIGAEPPMDWDDCEGAKKYRSIAKWIMRTEDLPMVSHEELEALRGLPMKGDFELEGTKLDFLAMTDANGQTIDNTPHPSDGVPRVVEKPKKQSPTPGILDIGSLSLNSRPREGVKYIAGQRGGALAGRGGGRRAHPGHDYQDDTDPRGYPRATAGRGAPRGGRP